MRLKDSLIPEQFAVTELEVLSIVHGGHEATLRLIRVGSGRNPVLVINAIGVSSDSLAHHFSIAGESRSVWVIDYGLLNSDSMAWDSSPMNLDAYIQATVALLNKYKSLLMDATLLSFCNGSSLALKIVPHLEFNISSVNFVAPFIFSSLVVNESNYELFIYKKISQCANNSMLAKMLVSLTQRNIAIEKPDPILDKTTLFLKSYESIQRYARLCNELRETVVFEQSVADLHAFNVNVFWLLDDEYIHNDYADYIKNNMPFARHASLSSKSHNDIYASPDLIRMLWSEL